MHRPAPSSAHSATPAALLAPQSDGLRDALSELPPSSEKLTFSFSPPSEARAGASGARYGTFGARRGGEAGEGEGEEEEEEEVPVFRIESVGTMGSTEVRPSLSLVLRRTDPADADLVAPCPSARAQMDYTDDKDVLETFECEYPIRNTCVWLFPPFPSLLPSPPPPSLPSLPRTPGPPAHRPGEGSA